MSTWPSADFGSDGYWHGGAADASEPPFSAAGSHQTANGRLPALIIRGGSRGDRDAAGAFALHTGWAPRTPGQGSRCCIGGAR